MNLAQITDDNLLDRGAATGTPPPTTSWRRATSTSGNMFRKLLDEATALQQAPRRNPYAKMLRREKGYYEHLARRLSRYLSALAD